MNSTTPRGRAKRGECRFAPSHQQSVPKRQQQRRNRKTYRQRRDHRRCTDPEQHADTAGPDNSSDTEKSMKAGHHGPAAGLLDDHRLDVNRHIRRAETSTESKQRDGKGGIGTDRGKCRQRAANAQICAPDHAPAPEPRRQRAGEWHGDDRASTEAKQQKTQRGIVGAQAFLRVRHERRPGRHADTDREERRSGRASGGCAVGQARWPQRAARPVCMRAAIASPIIIVVKCVLAWQSNGMIDASAMRSPSMPFTRPSGSTTPRGSSVRGHPAGAGGVLGVARLGQQHPVQLRIVQAGDGFHAQSCRSERHVIGDVRKRRCRDQCCQPAHAVTQPHEVAFIGQHVGLDHRVVVRPPGAQTNRAARERLEHGHRDAAGLRCPVRLEAAMIERDHDHVAPPATCQTRAVGHAAIRMARIRPHRMMLRPQPDCRANDRVVDEIRPDLRHVARRGDAQSKQGIRRTEFGAPEDGRGVDGAG